MCSYKAVGHIKLAFGGLEFVSSCIIWICQQVLGLKDTRFSHFSSTAAIIHPAPLNVSKPSSNHNIRDGEGNLWNTK